MSKSKEQKTFDDILFDILQNGFTVTYVPMPKDAAPLFRKEDVMKYVDSTTQIPDRVNELLPGIKENLSI